MLREVIEQVSGKDYISYTQNHVLGPMGITDMSCEREDTDPTLYYNTVGDPGYLWGGVVCLGYQSRPVLGERALQYCTYRSLYEPNAKCVLSGRQRLLFGLDPHRWSHWHTPLAQR